jgi:hypothetical protein
MSAEMTARHLALAIEHLARGERLVAEQRERIRTLKERGHETSASERFLFVLLVSLDVMSTHHATLQREAAAHQRRTHSALATSTE